MGKLLTVKELIAQKEKIKNLKNATADIYVGSLGGDIKIKAPSVADMMESQDAGARDASRADAYLLLKCVVEPNLSDSELQAVYECAEPLDMPEKIFLPGEISGIAIEIMGLSGYGKKINKVGKDLKK